MTSMREKEREGSTLVAVADVTLSSQEAAYHSGSIEGGGKELW